MYRNEKGEREIKFVVLVDVDICEQKHALKHFMSTEIGLVKAHKNVSALPKTGPVVHLVQHLSDTMATIEV